MIKLFISNDISEKDKEYYLNSWWIPFNELKKFGWVCKSQHDIPSLKSYIERENERVAVIYFMNCRTYIINNWKYISDSSFYKFFHVDDMHQSGAKTKEHRLRIFKNFDYIFCSYEYCFKNFFKDINPGKTIWYPHSIKDDFKVSFNFEPEQKLLLSGNIDENIYPARYKVKTIYDSKHLPIDFLEHKGYSSRQKHNIIGKKFIEHLSKYICCFTCCSNKKTPYIVAKFFEIPASGSLLLAYDEHIKKHMSRLGFKDGVNYISCTINNIEQKIKWVLDPTNKREVDQIRLNGYLLVWSKHTQSDRLKIIDEIANELITANEYEKVLESLKKQRVSDSIIINNQKSRLEKYERAINNIRHEINLSSTT